MKRPIRVVALATALLVTGCGGAASPAPSGPAASATEGPPAVSAAPGAAGAAASGASAGDPAAQFGGDVCSALTKAEIEGDTYTQGKAVFDSTDTQKDPDTGKPVVCQYLVTFGGSVAVVAHTVTLMSATEFADHADASVMDPEEKVGGIGAEAYLVAYAPGLYEVWVSGTRGYFKVGGQSRGSVIALATLAAGRD